MRLASRGIAERSHGDRRGTVLPMLGVSLVGLFAFTALAVDLGLLAVSRTECQNAADAAALIGCRTLNNNSTSTNSNLGVAVAAVQTVVPANSDMGANYTTAQISEIDVGQYLYNPSSQTFAVYNGQGSASNNLGWTNVTTSQSATPSSGSWTALQVTISYTQPMYFLTIFGVNSMPTGAVAAAVFRPRDTAFVLDMTGSMANASFFNYNNASNNPDTLVPRFGHYVSTRSSCINSNTASQYDSAGEVYSPNNYCIYTPDGPPIVRDYVYDPTNLSNPSTPAYPITSSTSSLMNAFHQWGGSLTNSTSGNYPPESGASNDNYLGPVYNFTGYNAFDTTGTYGPCPAPDSFIDQFDTNGSGTTITYVGDRWPRLDGKVWTTPSSWSSNSSGYPYPLNNPSPAWNDPTSGAVYNGQSYLGGPTFSNVPPTPYVSPTSVSSPSTYNSNWSNFRDPAWETFGYDLMMGPGTIPSGGWPSYCSSSLTSLSPPTPTYQALRNSMTAKVSGTGAGNLAGVGGTTQYTPINPAAITSSMCFSYPNSSGQWTVQGSATSNPTGSNANCFKGYSMGPGYWGKTFFIWPPDPRFNSSAKLTSPNKYCPAFDTSGNAMCDWRRHFFLTSSGSAFGSPATGTNINSTLFASSSSAGSTLNTSNNFTPNYAAILAWIKAGPQTLPPNLRAGRILFYSSIPTDCSNSAISSASGQTQLDMVFWQNYINYVLGCGGYNSASFLYAGPDNLSSATVSIGGTSAILYPWDSSPTAPYMNYNDSPLRPRLNFWFGPLSMCDFISGVFNYANWNPGTIHEAQCWQLKVAMNSVIAAIKSNHPNDFIGMSMFAAAAYNGPRVGMCQNYTALQNALFYPNSLLYSITYNGNTTAEERPYDINLNNTLAGNEIPNAYGSTDPNTGLAYAFNLLSASNQLTQTSSTTGVFSNSNASPPTAIYGTPRRGAAKLVIFETDGVPNTYRSNGSGGMLPTKLGYDTYYQASNFCSGDLGNGNSTSETYAINVVNQMTTLMASGGQSAGSTANSGLSLSNAPCYVYPIAFGDMFDTNLAPNASYRPTALQFLANVAAAGNTGSSGATTISSNQIIVGDYQTRINTLQTCLQDIFQSGVTVALIE